MNSDSRGHWLGLKTAILGLQITIIGVAIDGATILALFGLAITVFSYSLEQ